MDPYVFNFKKEDIVGGLRVFVFIFSGSLDFTKLYLGTDEYPGIVILPGQRIVGFDVQIKVWVEPMTGNIIKISESSQGDYVVDKKTGKKIEKIFVWEGKMTGNSANERVLKTKGQLRMMRIQQWWVPSGLLVLGMALVGYGVKNSQVPA